MVMMKKLCRLSSWETNQMELRMVQRLGILAELSRVLARFVNSLEFLSHFQTLDVLAGIGQVCHHHDLCPVSLEKTE